MIDKGLYKTRKDLRVGGASGREYDKPSSPAPKASKPTSFSGNEDRQQYSATQTRTGTVKSGGPTDRFISGDEGRKARDAFIRAQGPNYTGGSRFDREPSRIKQFISSLLGISPLTGILKGLNQNLRNTDFARSKNLMDYLDMKKFGGYDKREMARRIRMQEAADLQDRIDAGEFGGLDTMLDEVALTRGFGDTTVPDSSYDTAGVFSPFARQAPDQFVSQFLPDTDIYNQQTTKFQKRPEEVETDIFFRPQLKPEEGGILDLNIPGFTVNDKLVKSDVAPQFQDLVRSVGLTKNQKQVLNRPDVRFSITDPTGSEQGAAIDSLLNMGSGFQTLGDPNDPATKQDIKKFYGIDV